MLAEQPRAGIRGQFYNWVFPYFIGGIIFAAPVKGAYIHSSAWKTAFTLISAAALAHAYVLIRPPRLVAARPSARVAEEGNSIAVLV